MPDDERCGECGRPKGVDWADPKRCPYPGGASCVVYCAGLADGQRRAFEEVAESEESTARQMRDYHEKRAQGWRRCAEEVKGAVSIEEADETIAASRDLRKRLSEKYDGKEELER